MVFDEDAEYDEMGERMHNANLRQLTPYLSRPGHWRVRMNNVYEIMAVVPGGARGGPPQAGEFTFKVPGGGAVPTCGVLTRLTDAQAGYAFYMFNDLCKVARGKDLAHEDKLATNDSRLGDAHLADIREIVGELPPSEHEVRQAAREREAQRPAPASFCQRQADLHGPVWGAADGAQHLLDQDRLAVCEGHGQRGLAQGLHAHPAQRLQLLLPAH